MDDAEELRMPVDWTDARAWDAYYRALLDRRDLEPLEERTGSIRAENLPGLAEDLKTHGWRDVWLPGCGLSPLGRMLSHVGMRVAATDVSKAAVDFQQAGEWDLERMTELLGPRDSEGSFSAEVHDFHHEFRPAAFDLVVNVKAIQAFPLASLRRIACVHASSLREGRRAFFDTMNVQGTRRDELEQSLEDGGFVVPLSRINRWYRAALADTGIPHAFVLGQPMIPRTGEYAEDAAKREADTARLREITAEYRRRLPAEEEAEAARCSPPAKIATVIYSTG